MSHAALRSRLSAIAPAQATLQTRLLAALDGALGEGFRLRAAVVEAGTAPVVRFATAAGPVEIAPQLAGGRVPALLGDDGEPDAVLAMAALATLEPLVAAIERQLGLSLQPEAVGTSSLGVNVQIDALGGDGVVRDTIRLGFAADAALSSQPLPPVIGASLRALALDFDFVASGPSLAPARIGALAPGDFVLVGGRQLAGRVEAGGRALTAHYAPAAATVTIVNQGKPSVSDTDERPADLDPDLRLPLTLRIAGGTVSLGSLASLSDGSVLPLGLEGATMPVTIEVAGEAVAAGELVAVGDAYGVLITRRVTAS